MILGGRHRRCADDSKEPELVLCGVGALSRGSPSMWLERDDALEPRPPMIRRLKLTVADKTFVQDPERADSVQEQAAIFATSLDIFQDANNE